MLEVLFALLPAIGGLMFAELALLFLAPGLHARLAMLPVSLERTLTVPAERLEQLARVPLGDGQQYASGWREPGRSAWVRSSLRRFGLDRALAIGRLELRVAADEAPGASPYRVRRPERMTRVELRARWTPVPLFAAALFVLALAPIALRDPGPRLVLVPFVLLGLALHAALGFGRLRPALSEVADFLERELARPARPPSPEPPPSAPRPQARPR